MKAIIPWLLLALAPLAQAVPVFIGTGWDEQAKGIYRADFDPDTGRLSEPVLAAEYKSPGFLALHPKRPVLLAIGAPKQPFADGGSSLAAFEIGGDFSLKFLGEAPTGGKGACHLALDATGQTVAVASYSDGKISTVRLDAEGVPREVISVIAHSGSGPNASRQEGPHAHGVYFNRANTHLFVPDLGLDRVFAHPFDANTSKLGETLPPLVTAAGAGPRHLAFSPDERHAYVVNELDCTVLVASHENGRLTAIGAVPMRIEPSSAHTAAEIEVSADGKFVYASVRSKVREVEHRVLENGKEVRRQVEEGLQDNELFVFARQPESGKLAFVQRVFCGGKTPRHFTLSPCGKWLLCGHQDSHTISVLPRDPASGRLGEPAHTVAAPSPICILFTSPRQP
jgi:6-phosphogluconolactonase